MILLKTTITASTHNQMKSLFYKKNNVSLLNNKKASTANNIDFCKYNVTKNTTDFFTQSAVAQYCVT